MGLIQDRQHSFGHCKGMILILVMIFLAVFSCLAVSLASMSGSNVQLAWNLIQADDARYAAESGIECAMYAINTISLEETNLNYITPDQANQVWTDLQTYLQTLNLDGKSVSSSYRFTDAGGSGDMITLSGIGLGDIYADLDISFYRYDSDVQTIKIKSTGIVGEVTSSVSVDTTISKDSELLSYAVASRGRMWLTGDTTICGDIVSTWNRPEIACFDLTPDTKVIGTLNTVLARDDIESQGYQLETLDSEGQPIDVNGNPLQGNYEDRYYGPDDAVQGYHENINYDQSVADIPGMDISDYDTDVYNQGLTDIPSCPVADREVEYFPHAAGNYNYPRDGSPSSTWDEKLTRHVYENQIFTDARLPDNRNALFRNCTFEGVLYIDCYKSGGSYYNNVRFQDCTFDGVIVTDVPQQFKWTKNCLYFTGTATFNNQSSIQEATILAPQFNVNLGNTNPEQSDNNILTGAIVGGIVDVRGNAQIYGTIVSMCDTTQWSSGYVTNIGATLDDGGSETTELGDIGVIKITPEKEKMLPSGIASPIVFSPKQETYSESL